MNFVEEEHGAVKIIHHSTSSTIEIIVTSEDGGKQYLWMDYYDIDDLKKAIDKIQ